jgi:hypothetical protein
MGEARAHALVKHRAAPLIGYDAERCRLACGAATTTERSRTRRGDRHQPHHHRRAMNYEVVKMTQYPDLNTLKRRYRNMETFGAEERPLSNLSRCRAAGRYEGVGLFP